MISEEEARHGILQAIEIAAVQKAALIDALGRFAAQDYFAHLSLPVFDNSAMDGYAVIASDCQRSRSAAKAGESNARLAVVGVQPAGLDRKLCVKPGQAIRIFTGAPIPDGADAVVMQEDVERAGDEIVIKVDVEPGEFIRRRGCDLSEGQKILSKGGRISATSLALLASQGIAELMIGGDVTTAILSTGDELARPGAQLEPGQIFESNSILLAALLKGCGASLKSSELCRDNPDSLRKAIERGVSNRILIVTGGVSVGEHDLVQEVLRELGATIDIWRVAIKPGKPFMFGRLRLPSPGASRPFPLGEDRGEDTASYSCFIFGLPGNPVSAFVTFLKFVRPAILKMMGANERERGLRQIPAQLSANLSNDGDRVHYVRGRIDGGQFTPVGRQESHAIFGLSQANAIVRVDPGATLDPGAAVIAEVWD